MTSLLLKNATLLATMNGQALEIAGGSLYARDGVIEAVGPAEDLPGQADTVIDGDGLLVLPGLVNVHHHFFQNLTRALPAGQDESLFAWLDAHYPLWAQIGPEEMYTSALVAMAELLLSGCTTAVDQPYLFPNGARVDEEIQAARELGMRFHPVRAGMSVGVTPEVAEDESHIVEDWERVLSAYHDTRPYAMCRISIGPVLAGLTSEALLDESVRLARRYGAGLHMHVGETLDGIRYTLELYGRRTVPYLVDRGYVGPDVWYAHGVQMTEEEIDILARTGTGIAHCPSANMRLGSGIAPIRRMLDRGVKVGVAVDGSAGNDSGHMLGEVRMAMLAQRAVNGPHGMSAREALTLATRGGAAVLGRDDIGSLEPGKAADFIGIRPDRLEFAGAVTDPLAGLVFCTPVNVDLSVINGRTVVENGQLKTADLPALLAQHRRLSRRLAQYLPG